MTAERIVAVARSQLGTVESPPNSNEQKYGRAYGMPRVAWCAQFVWWTFREAGLAHLIPKTAYTPTFAQWFKQRGQWGTQPRPGAVVFFDFPGDGVNRISHVGIVEAVNRDGTVTCIEGNTSPGTGGSQRDGGGVWRRNRRAGIVGYGYPAYSATDTLPALSSPGVSAPTPVREDDDDMGHVRIEVDDQGNFHECFPAEAGNGSIYTRGWVTFGTAWGDAEFQITALGADGTVMPLTGGKRVRVGNNTSQARDLPPGTRHITVEGRILEPKAITRPWAAYIGARG